MTDKPSDCTWTQDSDGNWETGCGELFLFTDGGPMENGFRYCCYCGLELLAVPVVALPLDDLETL